MESSCRWSPSRCTGGDRQRDPRAQALRRRRVVARGRARAPSTTSSADCVEARSRPAPAPSTSPTPSAMPMPEEFAALIRDDRRTGARTSTRRSSRSIATTTSAWRSPTRWRAVEAGARQVECTINGIGERAGNAALEEIVMAIRTRQDLMPYTTGIDTEHITRASRLVATVTGFAGAARTRRSSAPTPSPTRRASTRTACSRTPAPTRS